MNIMEKRSITILPRVQKIMTQMGENIKLARLRRRLSTTQVAERAGITRTTLWKVEKGVPDVSMAAYVQVLFALTLENDLLKLAIDDELGRKLQDTELITGKRASKKK
jgi:transcriptional regulator with XRE-family HTH domain